MSTATGFTDTTEPDPAGHHAYQRFYPEHPQTKPTDMTLIESMRSALFEITDLHGEVQQRIDALLLWLVEKRTELEQDCHHKVQSQ